jgi:hypothetical protein
MGSLFWGLVALFVGWVPFVFWWWEVLLNQETGVFIDLLVWLVVAIVILAIATALWIAHNQRIARRGNRGLATRFFTLEHVSDRLGRALEMPSRDDLRSAARIAIRTEDDLKTYSIDDWGAGPR